MSLPIYREAFLFYRHYKGANFSQIFNSSASVSFVDKHNAGFRALCG